MKRFWFQMLLSLCFAASLFGVLFAIPAPSPVGAQAATTDTPTAGSSTSFVTNIFKGEPAINVRTGPSTIIYPVPCGSLPLGDTAPALGVSPAHEWILIAFEGCPNGAGWIYAANVELSGSPRVVELPPTPTPLATATIDPTLVAAFNIQPTETRLPTFTPAPPLVLPVFSDQASPSTNGFPMGITIVSIAIIGALVLGISFFGRR